VKRSWFLLVLTGVLAGGDLARAEWGEFFEAEVPFHATTLDAREAAPGNLTPRAIVLHVGKGFHVAFDPDLLRVAQSPFYARRRPPANLQDAILLLGFEEVRNLVWQIGLSGKVFRAAAFQATMASLRRHSVATAHLARLVGSAASQDLEDIFLAGLLHDAGLAVSLVAVADRQEDIPPEVTTAEMDAVLHEFHEGAGAILGALWELASPLCEVLTDHHGAGPQGPSRLAACVVVGQSLANAHGAFVRHEDGTPYSTDPPEVVADARRALGLTDDDTFESLAVDARILLDELPFA